MPAKPKEVKKDKEEAPEEAPEQVLDQIPEYRRIGHKGADAIVAGNTPESFDAAVEHGVDMIELDVLREQEGRLIVAHDFDDALRRQPMDLTEALDLFLEPPLDKVEIDCDLKLAGREAELVGALEGRGLLERAMVSTQEIEQPAQAAPARAGSAAGLDLPEDEARLDPVRLGPAGAEGRPIGAAPPLPEHPGEAGARTST